MPTQLKVLLASVAFFFFALFYVMKPTAQYIDSVTVKVIGSTEQKFMIGLVTSYALMHDRVEGFMDADADGSVTFIYVPAGTTDVYVLPSGCDDKSPYYSKASEKNGLPILAQFTTTKDFRWRKIKKVTVAVDIATCSSTVTAESASTWKIAP